MERVMGIEPTSSAWKAEVLPLNYTRRCRARGPKTYHSPARIRRRPRFVRQPPLMVEGEGFEPSKAEADRFTVCSR